MRNRPISLLLLLLASLAFAGLSASCGDDDTASSYEVQSLEDDTADEVDHGTEGTVVITEDGSYVVTGDTSEGCVEVDGACVDLEGARSKYCDEEGSQADVIVEDGEVVAGICYPPLDSNRPVEEIQVEDGDITVPQNANGTTVTFNEDTNGTPIEGDATFDAERIYIYGNGVDETIFAGNVSFASNNSRVRGLTIQGDLSYAKNSNNSAATFCKIHGDLNVEGNGFTGFECLIFGDVNVTGNNGVLVNLGVQGAWNVSDSTFCTGCYSFSDEDGDFMVAEEEVGDALACSGTNSQEP